MKLIEAGEHIALIDGKSVLLAKLDVGSGPKNGSRRIRAKIETVLPIEVVQELAQATRPKTRAIA